MQKTLYIIFFSLIVTNCSFKPVVKHHGVPFLEKKQASLIVNKSNKNDIKITLGPPSTKSKFDNDVWIYIERKQTQSKLKNFGKMKIFKNDVLVLEIDNYGILKKKEFYNKDDMEGNHLMDGDVNVIVSDGFTGNVALKTAEGTANFITGELKKTMTGNIMGKISSLLNISNLKKFKKRLDPRLYNGAIFIGLDSPVVKSHGGTDYIGFSNSLDVCHRIVNGNLIEKIKHNI